MKEQELEQLKSIVGEDKAAELAELTRKYDAYVTRFKKHINHLIEPLGLEAKTGLLFAKKDTGELDDGSEN